MQSLQQYIESVRYTPFKFGSHDCCLFAAKCVDAMHGTAFSGRVMEFGCKSEKEYRKLIREGRTLEAMTKSVLGDPVDDSPRDGDVVLARIGGRATLCIAAPPVLIAAGRDGVIPAPMSCAETVWRVG